jgi:hypothetical protein
MALDTLRDQLRVGASRGRLALDMLYKTGLVGTPTAPVLNGADIDAGDHEEIPHELLDEEIRQRRTAIAAENPDDPHLVAPQAAITDDERQAALEHLLAMAEGPVPPSSV